MPGLTVAQAAAMFSPKDGANLSPSQVDSVDGDVAGPACVERGSSASTSGGEGEEAASTSGGEDVPSPRAMLLAGRGNVNEEQILPQSVPLLARPPGLEEMVPPAVDCSVTVAADPAGVSDSRARLRQQGHTVLFDVTRTTATSVRNRASDGSVNDGFDCPEHSSRANRRRGRRGTLENNMPASSRNVPTSHKACAEPIVKNSSALQRHSALLRVLDSSTSSRKAGLNPDAAIWQPSAHPADSRTSPAAVWQYSPAPVQENSFTDSAGYACDSQLYEPMKVQVSEFLREVRAQGC